MPSLSPGGAGYWQVVLCVVLMWGAAIPVETANPEADHLNQRAVALTAQGQYMDAAALQQNLRDLLVRGN